jgi:hypothetical protein
MLQNIWYKETSKIEKKKRISTQRHRNISLLKRVLVNFSLVICMNYYYRQDIWMTYGLLQPNFK